MNNRYTFKAKRKDNGEWIYGSLLFDINTSGRSFIVENGVTSYKSSDKFIGEHINTYLEIDKDTISQRTGLKDKLGNEIYENDIVKFDSIETFIVKYDYTSFKLEQIDKQYCDEMSMFYHRIPTMFEVIGNVFDKEV